MRFSLCKFQIGFPHIYSSSIHFKELLWCLSTFMWKDVTRSLLFSNSKNHSFHVLYVLLTQESMISYLRRNRRPFWEQNRLFRFGQDDPSRCASAYQQQIHPHHTAIFKTKQRNQKVVVKSSEKYYWAEQFFTRIWAMQNHLQHALLFEIDAHDTCPFCIHNLMRNQTYTTIMLLIMDVVKLQWNSDGSQNEQPRCAITLVSTVQSWHLCFTPSQPQQMLESASRMLMNLP